MQPAISVLHSARLVAISCPSRSVPAMPAGVVSCSAHWSAATAGLAAASSRVGSKRLSSPIATPRNQSMSAASPMACRAAIEQPRAGVVGGQPTGYPARPLQRLKKNCSCKVSDRGYGALLQRTEPLKCVQQRAYKSQ